MKCILSVSTRFLAASSLSLSGVPLPTSCLVFSLEISWVQSVLPTCMCSRTLHWNVGGLPVATSWKRMEPTAASSSSALVWGLVSFFLIHAGTLTGSVLCSGHSCYQSMCGSVMSRPADISECSCPFSGSQSLHVFLFHSVSRGALGKNSTRRVGYTSHLRLSIHSPFFSVPGQVIRHFIKHCPLYKEASLTKGRVVVIYGYIHKYSGGNLTTRPFSETVTVDFPLVPVTSQPWFPSYRGRPQTQ